MSDLVFVAQTEIQFLALFGQLVTVGLTKQMFHSLMWFSQRTPGKMFFIIRYERSGSAGIQQIF